MRLGWRRESVDQDLGRGGEGGQVLCHRPL